MYHIIKDPVHGIMQFSKAEYSWLIPFIDSENFQRLRHIKQVGLCDWFFPGAVHTRLNHRIGCCYIASQIADKIGLPIKEKQLVMLACLLHDIGHGPLSHLFEQLFHQKIISHEMWIPYFLEEFTQSGIIETINKTNPNLPITQQTLKIVADLIRHQDKNHKLLSDIVSSQLDADRLDYLLRDSHFCGVSYGYYDFRWLLYCLTIIDDKGIQRLGIVTNGIGVVEHYLMARRLMTRNVYYHPKKYATEYLLIQFLRYLSHGLCDDQRFNHLKEKELAKFITNVLHFNENMTQSHQQNTVIENFLQDNYQHYKQLCDYDVFQLIRHCAHSNINHTSVRIAKTIQQRKLPKIIRISIEHHPKARQLINQLKVDCQKSLEDWQIALLDLPHQSYSADADPILVTDKVGHIKRLQEHSLVMQAISNQWEYASLVCIDQAALEVKKMRKCYDELKKMG